MGGSAQPRIRTGAQQRPRVSTRTHLIRAYIPLGRSCAARFLHAGGSPPTIPLSSRPRSASACARCCRRRWPSPVRGSPSSTAWASKSQYTRLSPPQLNEAVNATVSCRSYCLMCRLHHAQRAWGSSKQTNSRTLPFFFFSLGCVGGGTLTLTLGIWHRLLGRLMETKSYCEETQKVQSEEIFNIINSKSAKVLNSVWEAGVCVPSPALALGTRGHAWACVLMSWGKRRGAVEGRQAGGAGSSWQAWFGPRARKAA